MSFGTTLAALVRRRAIVSTVGSALIISSCGSGASTAGPGTPTAAPATATPTISATANATPTASAGSANPSASPTAEPTTAASAEPSASAISATGKATTIVIFDRGIDYTHPDFLNPDGTTRIKGALDMTGQNWCADDNPSPTEYTEDDFNAALRGERQIDFRDAVGHGTATAGMAAGNGSALPDGHLAGVAPEADLLIIKMVSEGAPAHDGLPAEPAFTGCLDQALKWADRKILELGQPAVAIFNAGTQWGPIDGTSSISRAINQYFPADDPGRIWVASSGDEGSLPNHAGGDYTPGSPASVTFNVTADSTFPTAWYTGSAPATVTIELSDGTTVSAGLDEAVSRGGVSITQYAPGDEFYPWKSTSGDHAVWMNIAGHAGQTGTISFASTGDASGHFDLYGDVLGPDPLTSAIDFNDSLAPGRVNDVASTTGVIVVGDYVAFTSFVDVDNVPRTFGDEGVTGNLWRKSSGGPTRDGRDVVDITAPGQNAFAPLASNSYWATDEFRDVRPQEGNGLYIRFGGTSAAAPIVVGALALMLQENPTLTTEQARQMLRDTAVADDYTGAVPNPDWGYGKLDIAAAVQAAAGGG